MKFIKRSLIKPLVYYGIRSHCAAHLLTKEKKEMANVARIDQELNEAKVAVTAFEGRYGQRLTWFEDKLWSDEGTEAQREEWKKEKDELKAEKKRLEDNVQK